MLQKAQPAQRSDSPPEESAAAPSKRRKATQACNVCRARKTGCDGLRPYCTSCNLRGWQDRCSYQEALSQPPVLFLPPAAIHAVEDESFYGPNSNSAFVDEIVRVTGSSSGRDHNSSPVSSGPAHIGFPVPEHSKLDYDLRDLTLPARQRADALLQCYWDFIHPICIILHRPSFEAQYDRLWQSNAVLDTHRRDEAPDVVFYSTLNIVLALSCPRYEALSQAARYDLADELISVETLDMSTLSIVQLLLRGIYLLYTPYTDRCWNIASVAIRIAQNIGLDTPRLHEESPNQLVREMRRRVWYTCVAVDRLIANTFGRPKLLQIQESFFIRNLSIPLPAPIDDEYLSQTGEGRQPANKPSRITFSIYTLQLQEILEKLHDVETKYIAYSNKVRTWNRSIRTLKRDVDEFLQALENFELWLPHYLHADESLSRTYEDHCFKTQAAIMKSRILYTRLRILRPLIIVNAGRILSLKRRECVFEDLSRLCVSVSHSVLEILYRGLTSPNKTFPWHTLYFAFAATSVLISESLCPELEINFDVEPTKTSWNHALAIFDFHKNHVASAEKGVESLQKFREYIATHAACTFSGQPRRQELTNETMTALSEDPLPDESYPGLTPSTGPLSLDSATVVDTGASEALPLPEFSDFLDSSSFDKSWLSFQDFSIDGWLATSQL
ncbi:fungal-specific transcription factor domain-containing protein [Lipomyces tetrasporus]|uniref:Fungal-specific transcription factor domain-containing protein n=1 Tax=Lipomyces tetrasporus TaxID=54092 RepID=A0AAD7VX25_9ASCO|nr:fungal-specific transcription factor domain-containing protein [Lipomyces tetrasporus]KAJ8104425.1 fungal-specific transcription factor domain-containing protein [Lipomyces tetrasporus]